MEQSRSKQKDLHMVFIDLEKDYDRAPRDIIWWALRKKKQISIHIIKIMQDMYRDSESTMRSTCGETREFTVKVGLCQGFVPSPYLFAIVLVEIMKEVRGDIMWCMIFAEDTINRHFKGKSRAKIRIMKKCTRIKRVEVLVDLKSNT